MRTPALMTAVVLTGACAGSDGSAPTTALLRFDEVARYGGADALGASLTSVQDVAVLGDELLVLESSPQRIGVFGLDGSWRRDIGRAGAGPGEFRGPRSLGVTGDLIWVGDAGGGALEVFDLQGAHVQSYRWDVPPDSLGARAFPIALLRDGAVLAGPGHMSLGAVSSGRTRHHNYYRTTPEGQVEAVLYSAQLEPTDVFAVQMPGSGAMIGLHPLRRSPWVEPFRDGSGLVVVEQPQAESSRSVAFRVVVISETGERTAEALVPYEPRDAHAWLQSHLTDLERAERARGREPNLSHIQALRDELPGREFYPPVTRLRTGGDGTIWVRREEVSDSVMWQVFDRTGARVADVALESRLDVLRPSLTDLWAVDRDELDVPYVIRMRPSGREARSGAH
jgi:hypothetical protein